MFGKSQAAGLIFSNIHDTIIPELTRTRTMASLPFGGRYRLVDFALSNLVGAGIERVGIITHNNYRLLLDHLEDGRDWDLSRRSGGIKILPPYITAASTSPEPSRPDCGGRAGYARIWRIDVKSEYGVLRPRRENYRFCAALPLSCFIGGC